MIFHAMTERYEEITVCGKPALFTSIRIKRDTVPVCTFKMRMQCSFFCGLCRMDNHTVQPNPYNEGRKVTES